jgi:hypothetical protein
MHDSMEDHDSMITTVTQKNMVTIPAEVRRKRVIPDRGEIARRLLGTGRKFSPERDAVSELVTERAAEG